MPSVRHFIALAFYAQPGSPSLPSGAQLAEFGAQLARRYHDLIQAQFPGGLDPQALGYITALAAMSPQRTAPAQAQAACRFFAHVNPPLPGASPVAVAAGPASTAVLAAATRTGVAGSTGTSALRAPQRELARGTGKGATKKRTKNTKRTAKKSAQRKRRGGQK